MPEINSQNRNKLICNDVAQFMKNKDLRIKKKEPTTLKENELTKPKESIVNMT